MKKTVLFVFGLLTVLACERSSVTEVVSPDLKPKEVSGNSIQDHAEQMVYTHVRLHLQDLDPFAYVSPSAAVKMKKSFDSLETAGATNPFTVLDNLSGSARMSASSASNLKQLLKATAAHYKASSSLTIESENAWYADQQTSLQARTDLDSQAKVNLLIINGAIKGAIRAMSQTIPRPDSKPGARVSSNDECIQAIEDCVVGNIIDYAGFGAGIGSAAGPTGTAAGALAGIVVAAARSIATCRCNQSTPCRYPRGATTPPVCYDPNVGLDVRLIGYGENPDGFELEVWDNPDRSGNKISFPLQTGNIFHISEATLQGRRLIYVRPLTNCGGDQKFAPEMVEIDLNKIGKPDFVLSGPQNPAKGSRITVYAVGPYTDGYNLQWYMPPYYGQILSTNGAYDSAYIQINSGGGSGYVSATLTESCGTLTQQYDYYAQ